MIDLHCHLLPYVDDGANDLEEAIELLSLEAKQGVTEICLTPHLRKGIFETPDEKIRAQYERIRPIAESKGLKLHLSREYHWDELTRERLEDGDVIPMGQNVLLTEFSARYSVVELLQAVKMVRTFGYVPLIAHVERYPLTTEALMRELREMGAYIQVNADAVLGYDGRYVKKLAWSLLKEGLADVIASDAHSTGARPPRMRECREQIRKKLGEPQAERLLSENPGTILNESPGERRYGRQIP
ncbi:MAG: capsular biosynthesis protein [Clostridia bacterium]|nr:capsular biosynthesis protein [Clostridia bacterium]